MSKLSEEISSKENLISDDKLSNLTTTTSELYNSNDGSNAANINEFKKYKKEGYEDIESGNNDNVNILNAKIQKHIASSVRGFLDFVTDKPDKKNVEAEIEDLKLLYKEMEVQLKLLKEKTVNMKNNVISKVSYIFRLITEQILAIYSVYRILMTVKNLLFQNYGDINVMLREEILNVIDLVISVIFHILKLDVETIYYTVIEQYFSLVLVGSIIIVNMRAFLNTILFIYTKTLKRYGNAVNKNVQLLFLSYFVGLFYVTSSIFLIFSLPITYR